ncbi:MAG: hypothetical protein LBG92_00745 [Prevotellaceae bacterium]|jgi:hypothetical protein|nr:hypothetical protein [Prevotellaceae bacterium]
MRKIIILLISILFFYSCDKPEKKVPYSGILKGEIKYNGGARNMELDNIIVTLHQIGKNTEEGTWRIDKSGNYELRDLPAAEYILTLNGNRVKLIEDADTIKINVGKTTHKNINIERLPYSVVVKYKDKEMNNGDTITFNSIAALDLWNKYSTNELHWTAQISSINNWITFTKSSGMIAGSKTDYALFEIKELPNYGHNYAEVIIVTEDEGTFTIIIDVFKQGGYPEKAIISGDSANKCPATSITLTASATGAISYKWYKGNTLIDEEHTDKYNVTSTGTYSVTGINANGTGNQSDGKTVTISTCIAIPATATISGDSTNSCSGANGLTVTLTASATRAENYIWRKGNEQLNETGNILVVSETGTYHAKGVNISGAGQESVGKTVTITSCVPANPTNVKVDEFIYTSMSESKIKLSWNNVSSATQYKIQVCDNPAMDGCEYNYYTTENSYYYFYPNNLPCGRKYFRIIAVNSFDESSGTPFSYTMPVSIEAYNPLFIRYNYATQAYMLGYIDATVKWYEGIIYYEIQRKEDNATWQPIATITGNTNESITTTHNYNDYTYSREAKVLEYRVRAYINTDCGIKEDYAY